MELGVRAGGGGIRGEVRTREEGRRPSCCEEGGDGGREGRREKRGTGTPFSVLPLSGLFDPHLPRGLRLSGLPGGVGGVSL